MRLPSASSRACSASSDQPLAVQDDGGLGGEGGRAPGGPRRAAPGRTARAPCGRRPACPRPRPRGARRGGSGRRCPRRSTASTSLVPLQQGHRLHAEGLADPLQQRVQAGLAAQHAAREEGEDLRLGAQPGRLVGAAGGQVHHGGHRDAPPRRRSRWRRCSSGRRWCSVCSGRGEVVVQQQRADGRRGQRRAAARRAGPPPPSGSGTAACRWRGRGPGRRAVSSSVSSAGPADADQPAPDDPGAAEPRARGRRAGRAPWRPPRG